MLMALYSKDTTSLFREAVLSVFQNTILPDAFVLVIDGPLGKPLEREVSILSSEYDLTIIKLPVNMGLAAALNEGLKHVKTEWVARADADDVNLLSRFETQLPYALAGYDVIGGSIREVDGHGKVLGVRAVPSEHLDIARYLNYRSPFNHMTVVFRAAKVKSVGGYPSLYLKEDYGLWALLLKVGCKFVNTNHILVNATSGIDMYKRRGGFKYILSEFELQKFMYELGVKNICNALLMCLVRSLVFMLPSGLRGFVYIKLLRVQK